MDMTTLDLSEAEERFVKAEQSALRLGERLAAVQLAVQAATEAAATARKEVSPKRRALLTELALARHKNPPTDD